MSDEQPRKVYYRPPKAEAEPINPYRLAIVILSVLSILGGVLALFGGGITLGVSVLSFGVLCFVGWLVVAAVTWRR